MDSKIHENDETNQEIWNTIYLDERLETQDVDQNFHRIVQLFKEEGINRILDLGSGSGRHIVHLAAMGFDTYGIDISSVGIHTTEKRLNHLGLKANLHIGSIYDSLPYPTNTFDAILSIRTIHHARIERIRYAIQEIERVLKPGGIIFLTVRKKISKKRRYSHIDIAPRTYVPTAGAEKGVTHYLFNQRILRKEFRNLKIRELWVDSQNYHCLLGNLR